MIPRAIYVSAVKPFTIKVKFEDLTEGVWDLSYLKDKPVFKKWADPEFFASVYIDKETYAIAWDEDIEICPDTLYLNINGLSFEDWKLKQPEYATDK